MNDVQELTAIGSKSGKPISFPCANGSRIPYEVYTSPEIYELEQERIFRGPAWSFVALEAELPNTGDFKSTFVGDTPVVVTRNDDSSLLAWVNRCAHRGAMVCRARGNTRSHICVYHQWSHDTRGNLRGVPFRNGIKGSPGMPTDFDGDAVELCCGADSDRRRVASISSGPVLRPGGPDRAELAI
jgi:anthranilate 1,2-dioxygenase large subunit